MSFIVMLKKQEPCDGCPREPWHDLHSRIEGPAAYDVLANFEERWRRASKQSGLQKLKSSYDDALLSIERISDIIPMAEVPCLSEDNPETWNVQVSKASVLNSATCYSYFLKNFCFLLFTLASST